MLSYREVIAAKPELPMAPGEITNLQAQRGKIGFYFFTGTIMMPPTLSICWFNPSVQMWHTYTLVDPTIRRTDMVQMCSNALGDIRKHLPDTYSEMAALGFTTHVVKTATMLHPKLILSGFYN